MLFKAVQHLQHPGSPQAGQLLFQGWQPQLQGSGIPPSRMRGQGDTDTGFCAWGGPVPQLQAQHKNTEERWWAMFLGTAPI